MLGLGQLLGADRFAGHYTIWSGIWNWKGNYISECPIRRKNEIVSNMV